MGGLRRRLLLLTLVAGAANAILAAGLNLKPGLYHLTAAYELNGKPSGGANTQTRCIVPADLSDPEKIFDDRLFASFKVQPACTIKNFEATGQSIAYDVDCGNREAHVEGYVHETSFSVVRSVQPKSSPAVPLKILVTGNRTGDCKP